MESMLSGSFIYKHYVYRGGKRIPRTTGSKPYIQIKRNLARDFHAAPGNGRIVVKSDNLKITIGEKSATATFNQYLDNPRLLSVGKTTFYFSKVADRLLITGQEFQATENICKREKPRAGQPSVIPCEVVRGSKKEE